jgi:hypothetical protein
MENLRDRKIGDGLGPRHVVKKEYRLLDCGCQILGFKPRLLLATV